MSKLDYLVDEAKILADQTVKLADNAAIANVSSAHHSAIDPFMFGLFVFILACFVGYYVVWKVTPALHTPLMAVTNAISGIIIVGAMISLGADSGNNANESLLSDNIGFIAVVMASVNIFGGFVVTQRMLQMFKKK